MGANPRTKGQSGEREIADMLNSIIAEVRKGEGLAVFDKRDEPFQRNQNQSAVGGDDLTNPICLSIEVKRQEQLSVNSWWKQCLASSERFGNVPILLFRQNRKKWRCCMLAEVPLQPPGVANYKSIGPVMVEVPIETFKSWFITYYKSWL